MAANSWVLTDAANQTYHDSWQMPEGNGQGGITVEKNTLRGGRSQGVDVIRVDNGTLKVDLLPTRGMGLWKAWLGDEPLGWNSPIQGPVHPHYVPLSEPSGLGWLDGFDELLVRCGLESNGAPEFDEHERLKYPLHGRIANSPAHYVQVSRDDDGTVHVRGVIDESRFHFLKLRLTSTVTIRPGEAVVHIQDEVKNRSALPAEMQMLYHVNFGSPWLDAGARLVAPVKAVVPRNAHAASGMANWDSYRADTPGFEEQVYFFELLADSQGKTEVLLKNAHSTRGASLAFSKQQLPCFTLWKDTAALPDGYVTGLEPGTNFPNPRSFEGEQGRVAKLPPDGSITFELSLAAHQGEQAVQQVEQRINKLQGKEKPQVFSQPQPGWTK